MNALTRFDPFNALLPDMLRRLAQPGSLAADLPAEIRLDVTESERAYEVHAEIPGAKKEDISVTVDGSFVSIAAEVRRESEHKSGSRTLLKETCSGRVSRGFSLAHEIEAGGVVAKLEDGVLKLTLPKRESTRSRTIAVQ